MSVSGVASDIIVAGTGAVSPAGWGTRALVASMANNTPLPTKDLPRPGLEKPLRVRQVPAPNPRPPWIAHARLRRTSPISQYSVAAALEALGDDATRTRDGSFKLGVIVTVMSGCVNYSRRFYDETLRDPSTASPLVFPETVFNAPSSHLAALLGTEAINYTLVGDPGTFVQGLALAADWLLQDAVQGCLVVGAEEIDWATSHAFQLFSRKTILSDGAGAIYLKRAAPGESGVRLAAVSDSHLFVASRPRTAAVAEMRKQLTSNGNGAVLVDGLQNIQRYDAAEESAWRDWSARRISPKTILGEGLMAAAAWQTVLAVDAVRSGASSALLSVVGTNQQAIGAVFA